MSSRAHRALLAVALALPLAVSGCGGDDNGPGGLDRNDPEAVARAYVAALYDCGARGAGLRWDLRVHDDPANEQTREEAVASERDDGCRPTRVPDIQTVRAQGQPGSGDVANVGIINPDACPSQDDQVLVLVRIEGGWAVQDSHGDPSCVRNGST